MTASWQKIDLAAEDGGLDSCVKEARVAPSIIKILKEKHEIETLRDLAETYTEKDHEEQFTTIWQSDPVTKDASKVQFGRLKSAWKAAVLAIKNQEETPRADSSLILTTDASWEAPLADADESKMWEDWKSRYDIRLEAHVKPAHSLVNRMYKEMRKWQMSALNVSKWKSILLENTPDAVVETRVGARSKLVEGVITEFRPRNLIDYYWGLRALANAWGLAGNYEVDSKAKPGTKVLMMPLGEAMDYADRGLRLASRSAGSPNEQLAWWARKDLLTRTLMANLVNEKHPAGEALQKALVDSAGDWSTVKNNELIGQHDSMIEGAQDDQMWTSHTENGDRWLDNPARSSGDGRTQGRGSGSKRGKGKEGFASRNTAGGKVKEKKGKGKGGKQSTIGSVATTTRSGDKLCAAFNSGRGCDGRRCSNPRGHKCGYIIGDNGTVCMRTDHGAANHRR